MADLSSLRDEVVDDAIPTEMPEQGFGRAFLTVLPQTLVVRLPAGLAQCWEAIDGEKKFLDAGKTIPDMDPATGQQRTIQRLQWNFDDENPLTVVMPGHVLDGQPLPNVRVSNIPRKRSNKEDAIPIAEATFLLRTALKEPGTTILQTPRQWIEAMARHAGELVKVDTGLSAFCNDQKVRRIGVPKMEGTVQIGWEGVEDPTGQKGCGKRYYTGDFKVPASMGANGQPIPEHYEVYCWCRSGAGGPKDKKNTACATTNAAGQNIGHTYLRGFMTIERWSPVG